MDCIPVIGVLTLIRHELLIRLIKSVDYPVENFVIIFQGSTNNFDFSKIKNENIKKFTIIVSSYNIGCSRGWNYIINNFPSKYWLICGDDTYFEAGTLEKINKTVLDSSNKEIVYYCFMEKNINGNITKAKTSNFGSFIFTKKIFDKVGIFDENIYPAYFEDFDIWQRLIKSGERRMSITNAFIYTGDENFERSSTLLSIDSNYKKKMEECILRNELYYNKKWNNGLFSTPFNSPQKKLNDIDIHENYFENQRIITGHIKPAEYSIFEILN